MDRIELVPMTAKQYEALMPEVIAGYAHENVVSGRWTEEESMHQSREQTERLLPQGLADYKTAGHLLVNDSIYAPLVYGVQQYLVKPYVQGVGGNALYDDYWTAARILKH